MAHGWQLPLTVACIRQLAKLQPVAVAPLGLVKQVKLKSGQRVTKERMTHDQSFRLSSGRSVNDRIVRESLTPCMYGRALISIIHRLLAPRI